MTDFSYTIYEQPGGVAMSSQRFSGVLVPVITPFKNDLSPDVEAFVTHCKWMLGQGVDGLAIFGTTS
jgi:4-hydroxy-tetrahydrodipicolinate synthase